MNSTEQLPQDHYSYGLPKWMVQYCGDTRGEMSVNGASTIVGPASRVIKT